MMNGDPVPRGGERQQPNPLFLAHAAALTELYVTLAVQAPTVGLSLFDYRREAAAREPFKYLGKQRALAPDLMTILVDEQERKLGAFVELDLGTMSHARGCARRQTCTPPTRPRTRRATSTCSCRRSCSSPRPRSARGGSWPRSRARSRTAARAIAAARS